MKAGMYVVRKGYPAKTGYWFYQSAVFDALGDACWKPAQTDLSGHWKEVWDSVLFGDRLTRSQSQVEPNKSTIK
jgi:hypothetical protein